MKSFRVSLWALLLFVAVCPLRAESEDQVTAQVRAFYQWYLPLLESAQDKEILQHHRKEMARYVTANRLAKIARIRADSQEGDYFLESLDMDSEWAKNIAVKNVRIDAKGRATAEVLLTGGTATRVHIKVTLAPEGGTYKIDAVDGVPDFDGMASAQLRAFYEQYLHYLAHAIGDETPMSHEGARDGVTADCLKKAVASTSGAQKVDYFLQSPDWDADWEQHVEVKAVEIAQDGSHGTAEVLLTGEKIPKVHLKVALKHEKDVFKIDEVGKLGD